MVYIYTILYCKLVERAVDVYELLTLHQHNITQPESPQRYSVNITTILLTLYPHNITKLLNILYQNKGLIVKVVVFISVIVFGSYLGINSFGDALKVLK